MIWRYLLPILLVAVALLAACGGGESAAPTLAPVGNAVEGEKAFSDNGCSGCHSTGTDRIVGPGLAGIGERASMRRPGLSAEDYIRESITDPRAFIVPDFPPEMPTDFANPARPGLNPLPAEEVENLIAYLLTLK